MCGVGVVGCCILGVGEGGEGGEASCVMAGKRKVRVVRVGLKRAWRGGEGQREGGKREKR